ncbi:MAG: exodeoxyribonuclease VII small subunit [Paramuribaculum sp.]|nr:exodeoxyribonuclease VII small subunit [Paramuribaculum sp.]
MAENQFTPLESMTYNSAISELENILKMMQSDQCDVDRLTVFTRRATELITFCRNRLTATDEELRTILNELSN